MQIPGGGGGPAESRQCGQATHQFRDEVQAGDGDGQPQPQVHQQTQLPSNSDTQHDDSSCQNRHGQEIVAATTARYKHSYNIID